ncbi:MAG: ribbon-helix-helix protein, CopG family [Bacteroidota bacterium]
MSDKQKKAKKTKKPIQIHLEEEQLAALRYQAEQNGESLAQMIREGVDLYLAQIPVEEDSIMNIIGIGNSKGKEQFDNLDDELYQDFIERKYDKEATKNE